MNNLERNTDSLQHYNHNHDALGRFTFSGGLSSAISSYRQSKTARLKDDEKKMREKLELTKAENARNETKQKLKSERKISKSKKKYYEAKTKALADEYRRKAAQTKEQRKANKKFDKNGEVDGKTAEERNTQRERLRKEKSAEIKEAIDTGSITKLMQYKDIMTTDEINRALNKNTATENILNKGKNKVDNIMDKVNWATKTGNDLKKFADMVDSWDKRSKSKDRERENERIEALFDKALKGNKSAEKELAYIQRRKEYKKTGVKPPDPKKYKHDK